MKLTPRRFIKLIRSVPEDQWETHPSYVDELVLKRVGMEGLMGLDRVVGVHGWGISKIAAGHVKRFRSDWLKVDRHPVHRVLRALEFCKSYERKN